MLRISPYRAMPVLKTGVPSRSVAEWRLALRSSAFVHDIPTHHRHVPLNLVGGHLARIAC